MLLFHSQIKQEDKENVINYLPSYGPFIFQNKREDYLSEFKNMAKWTNSENAKYAEFIKLNQTMMESKLDKKMWQIYKQMSKTVKTRNFRQCKSHHQKMIKQHKTIQNIILYLRQTCLQFSDMPFIRQKSIVIQETNYGEMFMNEYPKDDKLLQQTNKSYEEQEAECKDLRPNYLFMNKNQVNGYNFQLRKCLENEWRQCHQLFIQWNTKLKSLMYQF